MNTKTLRYLAVGGKVGFIFRGKLAPVLATTVCHCLLLAECIAVVVKLLTTLGDRSTRSSSLQRKTVTVFFSIALLARPCPPCPL